MTETRKTYKYVLYSLHGENNPRQTSDNDAYETVYYLARGEDVKNVVILSDFAYFKLPSLPATDANIEAVDKALNALRGAYSIDEDEALEAVRTLDDKAERCDDDEDVQDCVAWSAQTGAFALDGADAYPVHEYWDGSNWKQSWPEEDEMLEVEVIDDPETLSNYPQWEHGELHPVLTINGEAVHGFWLLREWSDWQGSRDTARFVYAEEREELLSK